MCVLSGEVLFIFIAQLKKILYIWKQAIIKSMSEGVPELSERELEILRLVAIGARNKEIALRLRISPNTVKVHLRNIFEKLGVDSRTAATYYAIQTGLVDTAGAQVDSALQPPVTQRASRRRVNIWGTLVIVFLILLFVLIFELRTVIPGMSGGPTGSGNPLQMTSVGLQRWSDDMPLPEPRSAFAVSAYEGALYLFGGQIPGGVTSSGLCYLPDQQRWQELRPRPAATRGIQAALLGEKIYIPGGLGKDGQPLARLDIYDPRRDAWEEGAMLPVPLSDYALAAFEGRLYLFGGWDGVSVQGGVLVYDPLQDSWSRGSSMPQARSHAASVVLMGKLLVIGGLDGEKALKDMWIYYPQRDRNGDDPWQQAAELPNGRFGMGAASLTDALYLFGGQTALDGEEFLPALEYLPQPGGWVELEQPPHGVGVYPAVLALGRRLHVLGGEMDGLSDRHQVYQALYTQLVPFID
jgi:DNA-binding CsgD family transcriptional regulator